MSFQEESHGFPYVSLSISLCVLIHWADGITSPACMSSLTFLENEIFSYMLEQDVARHVEQTVAATQGASGWLGVTLPFR